MSNRIGATDVFALAALHAEMAQTDREAARLAAREKELQQISALQDAATELENAATMTLAAGLVAGSAQISCGALACTNMKEETRALATGITKGLGEGASAGLTSASKSAEAQNAREHARARSLEHEASELRGRERDAGELRRAVHEMIVDRTRREHDLRMRVLQA